jgi:hypothetical protein
VVAIALTVMATTAVFSTRSAAGADASGYLSQAEMWSRGAQFENDRLGVELGLLDGWQTTPLGWRPAIVGLQAPTYPPGLPLLMAIPEAIAGVDGASAVVIVSAGVAILASAMLAAASLRCFCTNRSSR